MRQIKQPLLAVWLWGSYFTSLCFGFLIFKNEGVNTTCFIRLLWGVTQCLAQSKHHRSFMLLTCQSLPQHVTCFNSFDLTTNLWNRHSELFLLLLFFTISEEIEAEWMNHVLPVTTWQVAAPYLRFRQPSSADHTCGRGLAGPQIHPADAANKDPCTPFVTALSRLNFNFLLSCCHPRYIICSL